MGCLVSERQLQFGPIRRLVKIGNGLPPRVCCLLSAVFGLCKFWSAIRARLPRVVPPARSRFFVLAFSMTTYDFDRILLFLQLHIFPRLAAAGIYTPDAFPTFLLYNIGPFFSLQLVFQLSSMPTHGFTNSLKV